MWYAAVMRFFRRRIVLAIIFISSLTYCIVNFMSDYDNSVDSGGQEIVFERKYPFIWRTLQEHNETANEVGNCRNSVQGRVLIVDDRGYVCLRDNIVVETGCCDVGLESTKQYACGTCNDLMCCAIYEHCVSCCLHPQKKEVLEPILNKVSVQHNVLFASVNDHFELCLAKCRTNSLSVHHENSYRDPKENHCFGEYVPGTDRSDIKNG